MIKSMPHFTPSTLLAVSVVPRQSSFLFQLFFVVVVVVFDNPLSPINVIYKCLGTGPYVRAWGTYQQPHNPGRMILPPQQLSTANSS